MWLHPKDDPAKEGIWGRWAGFVTRHPLIPVLLAVALMVPLIIPVLSLELGQEDIGQTNPATMQRRAYDLMSQGYGPGFNGPLIIAVAVAPKAKGDPKVVDQENQLKSLQKTLKQEQKEGNQQQAEITAEQAQLEQQQAQLEHKQALLNQQSASLQAQQAQLEQQQAALEAQAAQLQAEANQLEAEQISGGAGAAQAGAKVLAVRLVANRAEQAKVERKLQNATNPARIAELQARLKRLKQREQESSPSCGATRPKPRSCCAEAKSLKAQKASLEQQKHELDAAASSVQAASLQAQAASLEQQGAALQQQGDELQAQANDLQQQGDQLQALQKKAKKQQKQADKLHSQLVTTLTKAGGDIRGTDPRLVKLQNALIKTKGDKLVSPPSISKKGERRRLQRDRDHGALVAGDRRPGRASALDRDTEQLRAGREGVRGRLHRQQRRPGRRDLKPASAGDRHHPDLEHACAAGGVPLGADSAAGGGHQLRDGDGGVRHTHRLLPVGLGHRHRGGQHRCLERPDRELRAADDVRDPVRAEHGLPGVPAVLGRPPPPAR